MPDWVGETLWWLGYIVVVCLLGVVVATAR
jgi:hypothetical protein